MESELTHQIKDSGVKHLITLDIFWPKIAALREQLELDVCYVTRVRDALKFPLSWLQPFSARRHALLYKIVILNVKRKTHTLFDDSMSK